MSGTVVDPLLCHTGLSNVLKSCASRSESTLLSRVRAEDRSTTVCNVCAVARHETRNVDTIEIEIETEKKKKGCCRK